MGDKLKNSKIRNKIISVLTVIFLSLLSFAGMAGSNPIRPEFDRNVYVQPVYEYYQKLTDRTIDPYLENILETAEEDQLLEIIVQFYDDVLPEDLQAVRNYGFIIKREFHAIPAVYGLATPVIVKMISEYKRTYWIEYNEQLEYLMDVTTATTNATKVWDSYITDDSGKYDTPIDGTGVTVVVVDSGIDAGHPDLDYGEKVILNYKSDLDGAYTSVENSDTSSGHGTHCSGTIGGNGDASAGSRRGMAPGCKLIGISTGEAVAILNALGALEWVYDHSGPNSNPYNIRVISNSWGTNSDYNSEDSIVKVSEKLTYENNVLVVFAAGNAGADDHDGSSVTTNPYSLTPAVISVAAMIKDASGMAYFSSRGELKDNFTWPDIGAPGYQIWATEARKTLITANVKQSNTDDAMDGYYMSISGTSMATPHVSGLAALIWQAAPSLRVSNIHDDYSGNGNYVDEEYWTKPNTLIHEVELIMKLTSRYVLPDNIPVNAQDDNGVPDNFSIGVGGRQNDFAQGYGFIDSEKAVALALTLETLRYKNPKATVWDALYSHLDIIKSEKKVEETNVMTTDWTGEWSYLNDGRESTVFTNHPRHVYVPEETTTVILDLSFNPVDIPERQAGTISLTLDYTGDGNSDWQSDLNFLSNLNGAKHDEISVSGDMNKGTLWTFNVIGQVASWPIEDLLEGGNPLLVGEKDFREGLIEYRVSFQAVLDISQNETTVIPPSIHLASVGWLEFGIPTPDQPKGKIEKNVSVFDLSEVRMYEPEVQPAKVEEKSSLWPYLLLLLILFLLAGWYYIRKKANKPFLPIGGGRSKGAVESTPIPQSPSESASAAADDAGRIEKQIEPDSEPIPVEEFEDDGSSKEKTD